MNVIYSPATIAVIDALSSDPSTSLHTRKLAEKAKVSVGTASTVLNTLEESGMLTVQEVGNMKFYKINLSDPVARQWKVLFNIDRLKPLVELLKESADQIVVFGSYAEGTNTPDSDVDLYVLTQREPKVKELLRKFEKTRPDSGLSPIILDPRGLRNLRVHSKALWENISRGRVLWDKDQA